MSQTESRPTAEELKSEVQEFPAIQAKMTPEPDSDLSNYKAAGKLAGKVAIVTGGDSGIGRAVAIAFAKEGANVTIMYLPEEEEDAQETKRLAEQFGTTCLTIASDVRVKANCQDVVDKTVSQFGQLDILVNNAAYQHIEKKIQDISEEQLRRTFDTNILGYFFMVQAALPQLKEGASIINTGSIVGKQGEPQLVDYASTKGAIHAFTKSLATQLGEQKIRVNAVLPGPIYTPFLPGAGMGPDGVKQAASKTILQRPGQPEELAPAYVLLASEDGSYITGSLLDVNGGNA
ncbi:glucose 1-dehydrogenase [Spirosoma sp. KUDC1026]|uniref:glucose 1-dehydrogenase n=1 Tax=Spirosoma sp. KUDC1026 TaxID=2745947 RepID=UPI00159BCA87|nr:glucose 1-dehydrogenase [Spirosoma sp. KUDC1026]QKZ12480.1 SDR family oxidoreductase [Spirosoma sp. KUDC1026]